MKQKYITVEEGWNLIADIGWGTKTTDCKAIAREYFAKLGKNGMKLLEDFVDARWRDLDTCIKVWETNSGRTLELGSDDSYSDLIYHIVGLGEAKYYKVMHNPVLAEERSKAGNYKESFGYCFQPPDPVRTQKDKRETLKDLLKHTIILESKIQKISDELSKTRMQVMQMKLLASIVAKDISGKE